MSYRKDSRACLPTRSPEDHRDKGRDGRGKDRDYREVRQHEKHYPKGSPPPSERRLRDSRSRSHRHRRYRSASPKHSRHNTPNHTNTKIGMSSTVPSSFKSDQDYLDTNVVMGYMLPRRVASTTFSEECGTAGWDVQTLPASAIVYEGLANWGLRYVASGQRGYFVMSRTYRESSFIYSLIAALKDHDLDVLISQYSRAQDQAYSSQDEKKIATQKFAQYIVTHMADLGPKKAQESLANRIKELEAENAKLATNKPGQAASKSSPSSTGTEPFQELRREDAQDRYLGKTAPASHKAREVNAWIKKTPGAKANIDLVTNTLQEVFDKRSNEQKSKDVDQLRAMAIEWGLPFATAAMMDGKILIKLLSATKVANQ